MIKLYRTLFWGLAALACVVLLSIRPQAAEITSEPAANSGTAGTGSADTLNGTESTYLNGSAISDAAGIIYIDGAASGSTSTTSTYTVIGNGTGGDSSIPTATIINGVAVSSSASSSSGTVSSAAAGTDSGSAGSTSATGAGVTGQSAQSSASISSTPGAAAESAASSVPAAVQAANYTVTGSGDSSIYSYEGHKYRKSSLYGSRKLTGYSAADSGTAQTASGKTARAQHTAAVPSDIPLGTVIIVEGTTGPYASQYTGVYVAEDRGSNVDAKGLIDLYFASNAEAYAVTSNGWNYANIYIAEAIE